MDISQLYEIAKSRPVNIFHLEDEEDWQEIVKDNVLSKVGWQHEYHPCTTLLELKDQLNHFPDLPILIVDLKLDEPADDVQGLAWLLRNIEALRNNRVEIFVLSGYIRGAASRYNRFLLEYNQLSGAHLYDKARFDEDQFLKALEAAVERLLKVVAKPWVQAPEDSIFAIDACIAKAKLLNDIYFLQPNEPYTIEVTVISLPRLMKNRHLAGKALKVYVYTWEENSLSEIKELQIPKKFFDTNHVDFEISFNPIQESLPGIVKVAIFYENNLLQLLELSVIVNESKTYSLQSNFLEYAYP